MSETTNPSLEDIRLARRILQLVGVSGASLPVKILMTANELSKHREDTCAGGVEAAAEWLMADDTAYENSRDTATRAARMMLKAAMGTASPIERGPSLCEPYSVAGKSRTQLMSDVTKTTRAEPEYTREEMREACLNNYNAGLLHAMEVVLRCSDETPPVEMFRAIQAELKQR